MAFTKVSHMRLIQLILTLLYSVGFMATRAEIVTSDVCNQNRAIIETTDHWYATAVYVDGYLLQKGDLLQNNEVVLQAENRLTLSDGSKSGNYFIETIRETFAEASADICP